MKVAISARGASLDAQVDPRFGRCATFVLVETDDLTFTALANEGAASGSGAGIQAARRVAGAGVKAVLTGSCGPNAHETLHAAGIEVVLGCSGTVAEAVRSFTEGGLRPASSTSSRA